jgi:hypothetical protein
MTKNQFFFLILFVTVFLYNCKEKNNIKYQDIGKTKIDASVKHTIDSMLLNKDCLAIKISDDGFCCTTDASVSTHFLSPNTITISYKDTSNLVVSYVPFFAFAYNDKENTKTSIVLQESSNGDSKISANRIFTISNSIKQHCTIDYILDVRNLTKRDTFSYRAQEYELILDKPTYAIGDTVRGYMFYKGLDQKVQKRWEKYMVSFRCIVGTSDNPKDYIDSYPKCSGIVNEVGLGKSRNIIAPPIKKTAK